MIIKSVKFIKSSKDIKSCPPPDLPEYALSGRSNVGKSSLLNMLMQTKGIAKTSSKPGKTILINHFLINEEWYFVDLPGFGYAQISKKIRAEIKQMIHNYLLSRPNLMCIFHLVDSRHSLMQNDREFIDWLGINQIPFVIVFTKADKISNQRLEKNIKSFRQQLSDRWESLPEMFVTSSSKNFGREQMLEFINNSNSIFY